MECPIETQETAELLLAYCARRLDPGTGALLERHIQGCEACRRFQAAQQAVWEALDSWKAAPASADFDRRLQERIRVRERAPWWERALGRPLRPVLVRQGLPLAAAACLLIMAGLLFEQPRAVRQQPPAEPAAETAIQPEQVLRTLDDMELLRAFGPREAHSANSL